MFRVASRGGNEGRDVYLAIHNAIIVWIDKFCHCDIFCPRICWSEKRHIGPGATTVTSIPRSVDSF